MSETIFNNLIELQKYQGGLFTYPSRHKEFHKKMYGETTDKKFLAWPYVERFEINEMGGLTGKLLGWDEWDSPVEGWKWENSGFQKPGPVDGISGLLNELEKLANPNEKMDNHQTLLHVAVAHMKGYKNIVEALLKNNKINVDVVDFMGWTPLHYASERNDGDAPEIVEALLKAGADVNKKTKRTEFRGELKPLDIAHNKHNGERVKFPGIQEQIVQHLEKYRAQLCITDSDQKESTRENAVSDCNLTPLSKAEASRERDSKTSESNPVDDTTVDNTTVDDTTVDDTTVDDTTVEAGKAPKKKRWWAVGPRFLRRKKRGGKRRTKRRRKSRRKSKRKKRKSKKRKSKRKTKKRKSKRRRKKRKSKRR
jgi:hypothetical protein